MNHYFYILASLILGLTSCDLVTDKHILKESISEPSSAFLGSGYSTLEKRLLSEESRGCVTSAENSKVTFLPSPFATIISSFSRDYSYHYDQLDVGVNTGVGPLRTQVKFLDALKASQLTFALNTRFDYNYGTLTLNAPTLTSFAKSLVSDTERANLCGDEFVDQLDVGANFLTSLVFHFKDKHDGLTVSLKILLDLFFGEITVAEAELSTAEHLVDTTVDLKIIQIGGDQSEFEKAKRELELEQCGFIRRTSETKPDYSVDLQRCLEKYNAALHYARTKFKDQILAAKSNPPTSKGVGTLVIKEARTRRYADAGMWAFQVDARVNDEMLRMTTLIEELKKQISYYRGAVLSLDAIVRDGTLATKSVFRLTPEKLALASQSLACASATLQNLEDTNRLCSQPRHDSAMSCLASLEGTRLKKLPYFEDGTVRKSIWREDSCNP